MKVLKIPKDDFVIKIEITRAEAKELLTDLNAAESEINFEPLTKELHKALKEIL